MSWLSLDVTCSPEFLIQLYGDVCSGYTEWGLAVGEQAHGLEGLSCRENLTEVATLKTVPSSQLIRTQTTHKKHLRSEKMS